MNNKKNKQKSNWKLNKKNVNINNFKDKNLKKKKNNYLKNFPKLFFLKKKNALEDKTLCYFVTL